MLMPTNCGKVDSMIPAHTIGRKKNLPPGQERADRAADQQRGDGKAQRRFAQAEFSDQTAMRAVHRAAVIAYSSPPIVAGVHFMVALP